MITNKYEETYASVRHAKQTADWVNTIANFLQKQSEPMSCKQIGEALVGKDEYNGWKKSSFTAKFGSVLRHLHQFGYISAETRIEGEPFEIELFGYIPVSKITVHDDKGNQYVIDDPKGGTSGFYKKTIVPKVKYYKWVG